MKNRFIILVAFLFCGCATETMHVKLTPSEPDIEWIDGVGMVGKNIQDIHLQVGYVELYEDMLSFYVIIRNESLICLTLSIIVPISLSKLSLLSYSILPKGSSK